MLLSLISSAIGFGVLDPMSSDPFSGIGTGVTIWTVIALLLSLFSGGFVAGLAARKTGMLHGFLNWAVSMVLVFAIVLMVTVSAAKAAGSVVSSAAQATGSAVSTVAGGVSDAASSALDNVNIDVDGQQLEEDTAQILRDTEIEELQPEYLKDQLQATADEAAQAAKDIAVNPDNADAIISDLLATIESRLDTISDNVDRDAIKNSVENNTDLTGAEADEAVDNAIQALEEARVNAKDQLETAKVTIEEAQVKVSETVDTAVEEGKEMADDAADTATGASLLLFFGQLIGAAVSTFAGIVGSKKTRGTLVQE